MELPADIRIREKSWLAWLAAKKLNSRKAAIVLGKTIHVTGVSSKEFLQHHYWVKHELCHVRQFKRYGFLRFIFLYLAESALKGYYNNRFEKEARSAESL